jgi:hypothetical protein
MIWGLVGTPDVPQLTPVTSVPHFRIMLLSREAQLSDAAVLFGTGFEQLLMLSAAYEADAEPA